MRVEDLAGLASLASALAGETVGILRAAASALDRAGKTDDAARLPESPTI